MRKEKSGRRKRKTKTKINSHSFNRITTRSRKLADVVSIIKPNRVAFSGQASARSDFDIYQFRLNLNIRESPHTGRAVVAYRIEQFQPRVESIGNGDVQR